MIQRKLVAEFGDSQPFFDIQILIDNGSGPSNIDAWVARSERETLDVLPLQHLRDGEPDLGERLRENPGHECLIELSNDGGIAFLRDLVEPRVARSVARAPKSAKHPTRDVRECVKAYA